MEFALKTSLVIGRGKDAGLQLPYESNIADRHCKLEIDPPKCFMRDLGSATGTWVNQKKAQYQELRHDDLIRIGDTEVRIRMNPLLSSTLPDKHPENEEIDRFGGTVISPQSADAEEDSQKLPDEVIRQSVPGYDVLSVLGKGAMGVVYQGRRKSDDKSVAIKLIVPESKPKPNALQLFVREASIVSQLNHPNLVQFLEFGMTAGQLFLVMEYVQHVSVQDLFRNRRPEQRTRLSCGIVCQVLKGLSYAHRKSLVHRDVKPSNILTMLDDGRLIAKLTDFGLAKNYQHAGFSEITQDGQLRGTVAFMPPEQILDSRFAKPTADIYATGVTLYQYLCGALPFEMTSLKEGLKRTLNDELIPLSTRRPDLPGDLVAIVHRAMAALPQDRFETAEEMLQALAPFTRSPPKS
ncbi:MAG: protein kinase [Planctomycetaceae bacterium]|nr:protein kinase [Planctomycetaceae bacterium]